MLFLRCRFCEDMATLDLRVEARSLKDGERWLMALMVCEVHYRKMVNQGEPIASKGLDRKEIIRKVL